MYNKEQSYKGSLDKSLKQIITTHMSNKNKHNRGRRI